MTRIRMTREHMSFELALAVAIARDNLPERRCRKCGEWKAVHEFSRDPSKRDGLRLKCRDCARRDDARYYRENAEKKREYWARYRRENAEKRREYAARYYRENPDVYRAARRRRRARKRNGYTEPYDEAAIYAAYDYACVWCGAPAEALDHFYPLAGRGLPVDAARNLVPTCKSCNSSKWNQNPLTFATRRGIRFRRVVDIDPCTGTHTVYEAAQLGG